MEGVPLRAVPLRPAGPVDPGAALAHVSAELPTLDEQARRALALVELGGTGRAKVAEELGVDEAAAAAVLARGRKALRRTLVSLPASGWCERAERLISDGLDSKLAERPARRLTVHLGSCDRCVAHERRLDQARDGLARTFLAAIAPPAATLPEPPPLLPPGQQQPDVEPPPAPLRAVPPTEERPAESVKPSPAARVQAIVERSARRLTLDAGVRLGWYLLFVVAVLLALAALLFAALGVAGVEIV